MKESIAALVGFYPAFSSLSVCSLSFIYLHLSYIKQLVYSSLFPPLILHLPSQHACFQSALIALASPRSPLHWLQSSLQQCRARTRSHKGRKGNVCVTNNAVSMHCISTWEEIWFYLKIVFFFRSGFKCCKKHKLPSVCQDLHPKRNYYYVVGLFFFIIYHS